MKRYLLLILLSCTILPVFSQIKITGKVTAQGSNIPVPNASVALNSSNIKTATNQNGEFHMDIPARTAMLSISSVGYKTRLITLNADDNRFLSISLEEETAELEEVTVSTGYQEIAKERATGSFVKINNELLNRRVSTNILERLEDVVPGLVFNKGKLNGISIRGQSTLFAKSAPLIVVDNFPYEEDISTINPNDVESITILKDAAAASIWGSRAGNGVIVITTKSGRLNQAPRIAFNSNLTLSAKPDLYYQPVMKPAEFIEVEEMLFDRGYYKNTELSGDQSGLTDVVRLLIAKRDDILTETEYASRIAEIGSHDLRDDIDRYLNRNALNQQYALSISSGSETNQYYVSTGYDKNLSASIGSAFSRMSLNAKNTYTLLNKKLSLNSAIYFAQTDAASAYSFATSNVSPYAHLADENGMGLTVFRDLSPVAKQAAVDKGLLNWDYNPLRESELTDNHKVLTNYRINMGLKYLVLPGLDLQVLYQFGRSQQKSRDLQSLDSYNTRSLINNFTEVNADGSITRRIPLGGILDMQDGTGLTHNFRSQAGYQKIWADKHSLNAIAGAELTDAHNQNSGGRLYGYDDEHASSKLVDYLTPYKQYTGVTSNIPNSDFMQDLSNRLLSYYLNSAYTYNRRYTASISGRIDRSNIFGVKSNQKGVPLYSAGLSWTISEEDFSPEQLFSLLKLRVTYGYNGNVDNTLSAYPTALYNSGTGNSNNNGTSLPYATIQNPPNPSLRWERVKILNFGLDFESKNRLFSGSVEYYQKKGLDLIGNTLYPASSGITSFKGNTSNTKGSGADLILNVNKTDKALQWESSLLFSYAADKVSKYTIQGFSSQYVSAGDGGLSTGIPLEGRPLYSMYSYQWGGLDPETGDPMGYLDGEMSKDYAKILSSATPESLIYHGSAKPLVSGAFRNTFSYKGLSLSVGINYRLGYYFRASSLLYSSILNARLGHADYALRWQRPGDETNTHVPSLPLANNVNRDNLYQYSEVLVERGDHIRLQDLRLAYDLPISLARSLSLKRLGVYVFANNLGIIWKETKTNIDPDYNYAFLPPARTCAFGIKLDF